MPPPKVQIVVLQYNNADDTVKCLKSVLDLNYGNFEVVVIDNFSNSENILRLENFISSLSLQVKLIISEKNLGYSGGNNLGVKYALENNADYVWILNNDSKVEKDCLLKLINVGETDKEIGILGPAINEGSRVAYGGIIKWLRPELQHNYESTASHQSLATNYYIPGAAMLIRFDVIRIIGLLDERYFLYFEDAEYSMRAKKAGWKLKIVTNALIYHTVSSSTRYLGAPKLLRYHYRNAHLFNSDHGPEWAVILLPLWSLLIIIKQLAKIIFLPAKRAVSRAILSGVLDFYFGRYGEIAYKHISW